MVVALLTMFAAAGTAQMQVRVARVVEAPIVQQLPLTGTVLSPRSSNIVTQESGQVRDMYVDAGDTVTKGDLLLQLDDAMPRLELVRLQALREEAELMFTEAGRLATEGRRLIKDRNISQTEYNARLAREASEEKRLRQISTQYKMQELRLQRHGLRAPFDGVIGIRHTQVGQWLSAGTPAYQLVQMDPLRVQARIPERFFAEVRPGTPVTITIDARPGYSIDARVDSLVPVSDTATRSFVARMDVPNSKAMLAPGMSAHLVFSLAEESVRSVLQVPADAVVYRLDGSARVWLVEDGTARSVNVQVGRRRAGMVEIASRDDALVRGALVVTLGNESLNEGEPVRFELD